MKFLDIQLRGSREVDLNLYGTISEWAELNAKRFSQIIKDLESSHDVVNLRIHSPGGSVFEGLAMFNTIKNSTLIVNAYIDGIAASMASVLVMACDKVYMAKNARMMLHQSKMGTMGTAAQFRNYANLLDSINKEVSEIYAEKSGKDAEWIQANWLKEGIDLWLTSKEALKYHLVDEVVGSKASMAPAAELENNFEEIVAHYNDSLLSTNNEIKMK